MLEEERRKLQNEIIRKSEENVRYKNRLLEEHQKQLTEMAGERQKIAKEWAELKTANDSVLDLLKPEALIKHEENIRQAAGKELIKWCFRALKRIELILFIILSLCG